MRHLPPRTLLLFTLLFVVALTAASFAFLYGRQTRSLVERYAQKIANCSSVSNEQDCFENPKCEGIYTSGCPDCPPEFSRCQAVPEKFAAQYAAEQQLCVATAGRWLRTKLGNFCECNEVGALKIFNAQLGCVQR